jgi:hypothetical protein
VSFERQKDMPTQPVIIKVWCRGEDLYQTASLLSWTIGHQVEIPTQSAAMKHRYFFVITEIEQYDSEHMVRADMGFDIIGKVSGVIDWEVMPKEFAPAAPSSKENDSVDASLITLLDDLPVPISIVQRIDGTYTWKWLSASGQATTCIDAAKAALTHMMKSYALIRSELIG